MARWAIIRRVAHPEDPNGETLLSGGSDGTMHIQGVQAARLANTVYKERGAT
jgi:hypothetical protein